MLRTGFAVLGSLAMTTAVITNAWMQKKQFYPTVVHLTRSNQSMLILYIQAFVLVFLFAKLVGKVCKKKNRRFFYKIFRYFSELFGRQRQKI